MKKSKKKKEERKEKRKERQEKRKDKKKERKEKRETNKGFRVLLPFRGMMVNVLKKKGIPIPSGEIGVVAPLFYDAVIQRKQHFDVNDYNELLDENLDPVTISVIIKAIIDFIKGLKQKKLEGKQLTEEESSVLEQSEEASKNAKDDDDDDDNDDKPKKKKGFLGRIFAAIFGR